MPSPANITRSTEETEALGSAWAEKAVRSPASRGAFVLALSGDLGAGKTTFVRGFLRKLGIRRAPSPTFILLRRHTIRLGRFRRVFHMDAYRLRRISELESLRFKEIINDSQSILLVEWAPNIRRALPRNTLTIRFAHGRAENERRITQP